jgi:hypothetical protein
MLDASAGLLSRISGEETLQGVHFEGISGNRGDIGRIGLGLTGEARDGRLNVLIDLALTGLTLSAVPADFAAYVPNQVDMRVAASGVRIAALTQWLRDATNEDPDRSVLAAQGIALLADPETRVGIERMTFDVGPLRVEGSSQVRPLPDGTAGLETHVRATGVDALMAQAQGNPAVAPLLPMVFLAKGLARAEGDALVWDITYGDGVATVNGMPLGGGPRARGKPVP